MSTLLWVLSTTPAYPFFLGYCATDAYWRCCRSFHQNCSCTATRIIYYPTLWRRKRLPVVSNTFGATDNCRFRWSSTVRGCYFWGLKKFFYAHKRKFGLLFGIYPTWYLVVATLVIESTASFPFTVSFEVKNRFVLIFGRGWWGNALNIAKMPFVV